MSYQVLARKWRPRVFAEVVGQESVLRALINALDAQRLHHAYLFTGTRGVGKTTLARILAMCFNCEQGVSSKPCGQCAACTEIKQGRFVDLIEVDAASRTKVEDTRELLDNVQYAPTTGRYKVYLIDEVHMLSSHSFNALLKTLEEPPEHVKFLLATTDPQKLPITVLSRCLQFSLKNMTADKIVGHLQQVLNAEKVTFDDAALWSLARAAQGSMRDALSLTDQAIAFGQGVLSEAQVNDMLGTLNRQNLYELAQHIAQANAQALFAEAARLSEQSVDYNEICQSLLSLWHRAAIAQISPDAIDDLQGDKAAILQLAQALQAEDIQLFYQITLSARQELALAPEPQQAFEMMLLRLLAFRPAQNIPAALDVTSSLQVATGTGFDANEKKNIPHDENAASADNLATPTAAYTDTPTPDTKATISPPPELDVESMANSEPVAELQPTPEPVAEPITHPEPTAQGVQLAAVPSIETWQQDIKQLHLAGIDLAIMRNSALAQVVVASEHADGYLEFDVSQAQEGLLSEGIKKRLINQITAYWQGYQVVLQVAEPRYETPYQQDKRRQEEQMQATQAILQDDANINKMLDFFDGHIIEESITPIH